MSETKRSPVVDIALLLRDEAVALEQVLALVLPPGAILEHLTDSDLDRLDHQLRRVLLRVAHLAKAREEER